ncbi:hypothetical protein AGLY_014276 [Aphis glycines]|uniref:Uncharacterized protein n=1 Tax=Aphis glycines TaxID=307491 RepID=A0A6G0T468_APHGL|nr:hypothetical protein AGLY_014276 [Aphis glycines]
MEIAMCLDYSSKYYFHILHFSSFNLISKMMDSYRYSIDSRCVKSQGQEKVRMLGLKSLLHASTNPFHIFHFFTISIVIPFSTSFLSLAMLSFYCLWGLIPLWSIFLINAVRTRLLSALIQQMRVINSYNNLEPQLVQINEILLYCVNKVYLKNPGIFKFRSHTRLVIGIVGIVISLLPVGLRKLIIISYNAWIDMSLMEKN